MQRYDKGASQLSWVEKFWLQFVEGLNSANHFWFKCSCLLYNIVHKILLFLWVHGWGSSDSKFHGVFLKCETCGFFWKKNEWTVCLETIWVMSKELVRKPFVSHTCLSLIWLGSSWSYHLLCGMLAAKIYCLELFILYCGQYHYYAMYGLLAYQ